MNFRTTMTLAVALLVVVGVLYFMRGTAEPTGRLAEPTPAAPASEAEHPLLPEGFDEPAEITCQFPDQPKWVFRPIEATSGEGAEQEWEFVEPVQGKAQRWRIDSIRNRLKDLTYAVKYAASGALTPEQAGLNPPRAVIGLTNAAGKTVEVAVGKLASAAETYVALDGGKDIYLAKSPLDKLVENKLDEYRDKQLLKYEKDDVAKVEIEDRKAEGGAVVYRAVKSDDGEWAFESPVQAAVDDATMKAMLSMGANLSVHTWIASEPDKLAAYGLDPPARTVRITTRKAGGNAAEDKDDAGNEAEAETQTEAEGDIETEAGTGNDNAAAPAAEGDATPPETTTEVYTLHLSDRSPMGEDTKVYVRLDGQNVVGTLLRSQADKLAPSFNAWRDRSLADTDVLRAERIKLTVGAESAVLTKDEGTWSYEDAAEADGRRVRELLDQVSRLKALALLDGADRANPEYGLSSPQAAVELTIPGRIEPLRFAVGAYSDQTTKRTIYAHRDGMDAVAKLRADDVQKLLQSPSAYRDMTILNIAAGAMQKVELTRHFADTDATVTVELTQAEDRAWKMTAPIEADPKTEQVTALLTSLGSLTGEGVTEASPEMLAALESPDFQAAITHNPPPIHHLAAEEGAEATVEQPPAETVGVSVAKRDDRIYARRSDRDTVYLLDQGAYGELFVEFHSGNIFEEFQPSAAKTLTIRNGATELAFTLEAGGWKYAADPDLPIDGRKIENLLRKVPPLETPRYVAYAAEDLAPFGLAEPARSVEVTLEDGTKRSLRASSTTVPLDGGVAHYATLGDGGQVFLLKAADLDPLTSISIAEYEAKK